MSVSVLRNRRPITSLNRNLINPSDLLEMTDDDWTGVVLSAQQINQPLPQVSFGFIQFLRAGRVCYGHPAGTGKVKKLNALQTQRASPLCAAAKRGQHLRRHSSTQQRLRGSTTRLMEMARSGRGWGGKDWVGALLIHHS